MHEISILRLLNGGTSVEMRCWLLAGRGEERRDSTATKAFPAKQETKKLTPRHLLRQLEPSLFVRGQTTSLVASETEKELVRVGRGGMAGEETAEEGEGDVETGLTRSKHQERDSQGRERAREVRMQE